MRVKRIAFLVVVLIGLLVGAWVYVSSDGLGDVHVPAVDPATTKGAPAPEHGASGTEREQLHEARRTCEKAPLDRFIHEQWELVHAETDDAARGRHLHVLAEAHLERIYYHNAHLGMKPGEPLYDAVPTHVAADARIGLMLLKEARKLGVSLADGYRVEAGLLASRITGMFSAMDVKRELTATYRTALEMDGENPRLHVALGCRKLLAPRMLGRNVNKALEHFAYACSKLPHDERPRIFAAMAAWLKRDRDGALFWARDAVATNDRNRFGVAVLKRLEAREADPFGRDIPER